MEEKKIPHIKNLVFEGGGVKGIAYCGALQILEEQGVLKDCIRFSGTSAGAITAWLCACHKNGNNKFVEQVATIQRNTNFSEFSDSSYGFIRNIYRLFSMYGWHKGDKFYSWVQSLTQKRFNKKSITFMELFDKTGNDLVIVGYNASRGVSVNFSKEKTPDFYVENALRISMSIPIYFSGVFINKNNLNINGSAIGNPVIKRYGSSRRDIFVDGGISDNFPIQLFDKEPYDCDKNDFVEFCKKDKRTLFNKATLGLRVDSSFEFERGNRYDNNNLFEYLGNLAVSVHLLLNKRHLDDHDWMRTLRIDVSSSRIGTTDFNLSKKDQNYLIELGKKAAEKYLREYAVHWHDYLLSKQIKLLT